jgi:predicted Zn-dependent protease
VRQDPEYLLALAQLGELLLRNGEAAQALVYLDRAAVIDGSSLRVRTFRGLALLSSGRPAEAEQVARQIVRIASRFDVGHYVLGMSLVQQGRFDQETAAQLALAAGKFPDALEWLAWTREHLGSEHAPQRK